MVRGVELLFDPLVKAVGCRVSLQLFPHVTLDSEEGIEEGEISVLENLAEALLGLLGLGQLTDEIDLALVEDLRESGLALALVQLLQRQQEEGIVLAVFGDGSQIGKLHHAIDDGSRCQLGDVRSDAGYRALFLGHRVHELLPAVVELLAVDVAILAHLIDEASREVALGVVALQAVGIDGVYGVAQEALGYLELLEGRDGVGNLAVIDELVHHGVDLLHDLLLGRALVLALAVLLALVQGALLDHDAGRRLLGQERRTRLAHGGRAHEGRLGDAPGEQVDSSCEKRDEGCYFAEK